MLQDKFKKTYNQYNLIFSKVITKIINDNQKYYNINETIKWKFGYDDNLSIMCTCDRKTNIISINIFSVEKAFNNENFMDIEYYLIHEIRHIFQHIKVEEYNNKIENGIAEAIIKKWINEFDHYEKALDENGNENIKYFMQDCEMDAYAFSLAVMRHKYGDTIDLYIPPCYKEDFYELVDSWILYFKENI